MGHRLNRLNEPIFMAVSKPLLTEFGIHHRLECCIILTNSQAFRIIFKKNQVGSEKNLSKNPRFVFKLTILLIETFFYVNVQLLPTPFSLEVYGKMSKKSL